MSLPKVSKMHQRVNMSEEERTLMDAMENNPVPPNTFWDDATNLYVVSMEGLEQTHGILVDHLQSIMLDPVERAKITDEAGLAANVNLLTKDVQTHVELLKEIYADHADKKGGTASPEEHMEVIVLNGRYQDAIELYNSVIMPTVAHIFEQTNMTDNLIAQQISDNLDRQNKDLTDPSVVTDVAVKEEVSND